MRRAVGKLMGPACALALIVACFHSVLWEDGQFAFRDAARFYYPLHWRVQREWSLGHLPLWDPGLNGGQPLLGRPMAAALYPGKLVFALFPYPWAVRLYTIGHEALAFAAMLVLMRAWKAGWAGAGLAGLSYAFGGIVLSDYFNIILLVGAAWLPLGVRAVDAWLRLGRRWAVLELALVLSMQVLGGDPESAYLTMVAALGYALVLSRARAGREARPGRWALAATFAALGWLWAGPMVSAWAGPALQLGVAAAWALGLAVYWARRPAGQRAHLAWMLVGLATGGALALALAGVQIVPALEVIASSVRWAGPGLEDLYDSSLLPYRALEWFWPNVFGTFTAGNHYGALLLPPVGGVRPSPLSLYAGALPIVLALGTAGFRGGPPWRPWLAAIALLTFWAALGEFAGWARWQTLTPAPNTGDDSFYGMLALALPGFRLFRLPFKMLAFTALALSALAGRGWDRVSGVPDGPLGEIERAANGRLRRRCAVIATAALLATLAGLAVSVIYKDHLISAIEAQGRTHLVFGPLDANGAVSDMLKGLAHGAVALSGCLLLLVWAGRRARSGPLLKSRRGAFPSAAALVFLTVDLAIANAPLAIAAPQAVFDRVPEALRAIQKSERDRPEPVPGPFRIQRMPSWAPIGWDQTPSSDRLRELLAWEIDTLQPGFGLLHGLEYVHDDQSETARAVDRRLFQPERMPAGPGLAAVLGVPPGRPIAFHPRAAFDLWGARYFIVPAYPGDWSSAPRGYAAFLEDTDLVHPDTSLMEGGDRAEDRRRWLLDRDVLVRRNRRAFPRAWVVHDAHLIRPLDASPPAARDALIARLRQGDVRDLRRSSYLETARPEALAPYLPAAAAANNETSDGAENAGRHTTETVSVHYESAARAVIEARLDRPGVIVLADAFAPGWGLSIDGRPAEILRANLSMRGAAVAAGPHQLIYTYAPNSAWIGAVLSLAGLIALAGLAAWARQSPTKALL